MHAAAAVYGGVFWISFLEGNIWAGRQNISANYYDLEKSS